MRAFSMADTSAGGLVLSNRDIEGFRAIQQLACVCAQDVAARLQAGLTGKQAAA